MRKPDFCICENKDADQLRGSREADQRLCFRYTDSTIPLLPISETLKLAYVHVAVHSSLYLTWSFSPTPKFLIMLTRPCNVDPLTPGPHFYIVKTGFTRVYAFLNFCSKT